MFLRCPLFVRSLCTLALLLAACPSGPPSGQPTSGRPSGSGDDTTALAKKASQPPVPAEKAPSESSRLGGDVPTAEQIATRVQTYFAGHIGRRVYVQIDKPLYKPGETVWVRTWDLVARSLTAPSAPAGSEPGMQLELVSPRGAVVAKRKIHLENGAGQADFALAEGIDGGEYTLRATSFDGQRGERPLIVSTYEAPRLKMKLEFVRKAYGAGDEVSATIEVKRATGEPLRNHPLSGLVRLDGQDLPRVALSTNQNGEGVVRFTLPAEIQNGDGLLTVLADDGGLTESVAKRIPIIVRKLQFSLFPEGGQLIEGLPGRVYFEAKTPLGKPADVSGRIVDDHGAVVARFDSVRDGLGRFDFTPGTGRSYHAEIDKPVGVSEKYTLPLPARDGCSLRSFDDLDGELPALRVAVRCSEARKVAVVGMLRENLLDAAMVAVPANAAAVVYLRPKAKSGDAIERDNAERLARQQGVARVTVFDDKMNPLAERLVYRNRRHRLAIQIEPHKKSYSPRDQVTLAVTTLDPQGQPQPATLAMSVVDDTVLSFADDKTGHMLSRLYLEPEIADKVEEPNFYFDLSEEKSALAMDLLMGTRGYRKFEWMQVLVPPAADPASGMVTPAPTGDFGGLRRRGAAPAEGAVPPPPPPPLPPAAPPRDIAEGAMKRPQGGKAMAQKPMAAPVVAPVEDRKVAEAPRPGRAAAARGPALAMDKELAAPPAAAMPAGEMAAEPAKKKAKIRRFEMEEAKRDRGRVQNIDEGDERFDDEAPMEPPAQETWAPVRVFPAPTYAGDYSGPRTDFRETIAWQPVVHTGKDGRGTVTFYLSDAVTSFRVVSEGVGGGVAGRDETVIKSNLPFSMAVKLPTEVSAEDRIRLPLVLSNERDKPQSIELEARFGDLLVLEKPVERTGGTVAAKAREALFYPLTVSGKQGKTEVRFAASAAGLRDEFVRELRVTPLGFPQQHGKSGQVQGSFTHEVDLGAAMPGTIDGVLKLYPSPVATMISGLDGMLQQPSGCFEQTSSTNYPNVMILRYLKQQNLSDPRIMERAAKLIDDGYKRLVSFETKEKGYEWFGGLPAHEALSAYGLLEFLDMKEIFDVDGEMVSRTTLWLRSRRDGKGGYLRDAKALDSFGGASPEVTNAYITYSLTEAKQTGLDAEIEAASRLAGETRDAYLLSLAVNTLLNAGRSQAGRDAAKRLIDLQEADGGFVKADHSITRSTGVNLSIETTSLAVMALLKAGGFDDNVRKAVEWLTNHRGGYGAWGATQATVLALKAMTAYSIASTRMAQEGSVTLSVNGVRVGTLSYEAGHREPLVFDSLGQYLKPGKNTIEVQATSQSPLPLSLGIDYRSLTPATSPEVKVDLTTALERNQVRMGESVRLNVTLSNKTAGGLPMTLARVGIPGGLSFQTWQLKELREKGAIAFYETQARQVILYLREMKPSETVKLPIDLLATVPGTYRAPASSAYLYYTDDHKVWADGTRVTIEP
ncbi:MG2 domain-containing protein [Haliangium sp. UPWRP_2]|uniref:MG2 domain-containing protein n=1 Tax=Haliangium sp. UPWRP_2 TaxID=1931276 RepID=UPI000B54059E|nr:MG2 domain-containing protein [Haliangium sp. UPWRP_2]PSM32291.1 hypothetical protein BVG81_001070 [Haliangium sp. UPWRP_2]